MALRLITENEFRQSPFGQLADQIEGRLQDVITRAEGVIENKLGRVLSVESYVETRLHNTSKTIFLPHRPLQTVTSVSQREKGAVSWTALDLTRFYVEKEQGWIEDADGGLNIVGFDEIKIEYTAGLATIPAAIKEAVIRQTALLTYQDTDIFGGNDKNEPSVRYLWKDIEQLLAEFKQIKGIV